MSAIATVPGSLMAKLGSSMGARIAMAVLNYALFWDLSHRLPGAELGGFSLLMNIFFLVQALPLLGLSSVVMRRVATFEGEREAALRRELSTALVFALPIGALIAASIFLGGRLAYPSALHGAFDMLALALLPSAAIMVFEYVLLGCERMAVVAWVQCFEALGRTLLGVLAVHLGYGLTGVFAVFCLLRVIGLGMYVRRGGLPMPRWAAFSASLWREYWSHVPVFFSIVLLAAMTSRIDMVVLSRLRPLHDVGLYAAASRLYDAALMLPTVAAMVVMPALSRSYESDRARFHLKLADAVRSGLMLGIAPALVVASLAEPIIQLLYAPALDAAAPILRWLIFGAVLMTVDQMLSSTMLAAKAQDEDLRTVGIALVSLLVGLGLLVPWQGPLGAAQAVILALLVRVAWRLRWVLRNEAIGALRRDVGCIALAAGAGLAMMLFGLRLHPVLGALMSVPAYVLTLWAFGLVSADSLRRLRSAWGELRGRAPAPASLRSDER